MFPILVHAAIAAIAAIVVYVNKEISYQISLPNNIVCSAYPEGTLRVLANRSFVQIPSLSIVLGLMLVRPSHLSYHVN
jgi:hypothetical protein